MAVKKKKFDPNQEIIEKYKDLSIEIEPEHIDEKNIVKLSVWNSPTVDAIQRTAPKRIMAFQSFNVYLNAS